MSYEKTSGTSPSGGMSAIRQFGRISLFFATAGFACPNVFSEDLDTVKPDTETKIKIEKL